MSGAPARAALAAASLLALALAGAVPPPAHAAPRPLPKRVVEAFEPARRMFARGAGDSAYAALEAIGARAAAAKDDTLFVAARFELGARLAWFGQVARAVPALREARERAWAIRDSARWAQSSQWLAFAMHSAGEPTEAGAIARRALPAAVAIGDVRTESYLRLSLAYEALLAGRAAEARRGYRRALPLFEAQRDAFGACDALLGLGRTYSVTGPRDSARAMFERAAARAEDARLPRSAASAHNNLATLGYTEGDPEAALASWRYADRMARAAGDLQAVIAASGNVCLALANLDRLEEARTVADSLLAYVTRAGSRDGVVRARARVGFVELSAGRLQAAAREYRAALALAPREGAQLRAECAAGLVRALYPDSAASALALYARAAAEAAGRVTLAHELELAEAGSLAALAADSRGRAEAAARRALALAREARSASAEMGAQRVLALAAARSGRHRDARAHLEAADLAWSRTHGRAAGVEWRSTLSQPVSLGSAWAEVFLGDATERRRERLAPAFAALERLRSTVLLELASGPGSRKPATPAVTLDRMQRSVLAPGELLLLFWTWSDRSWLIAVARDTAVSVPLPPFAKLDRDVTLLREALAAEPPLEGAALDRMLADAGARLLEPVVPLLRRHPRVVLVPAGPLQRLPFEALRLPLGPGGASAALGVTHVLARAPSASVLALTRSRAAAPRAGNTDLLAVANPRGPGGRTLPGALDEVRALERRYRGSRAIEHPRDAGSVLSAMAAASAVHVAAHAEFDPASPWRSTLALAEGGPVRARDLLAHRLPPGLVVLAACETAGGRARGTGGMEGLSTALLCAGTRGVVATLWPVEDRTAKRFAEAFYEEAEGAPDAGAALARARRRLQAEGEPARDWAAFTLVGDPATPLRLVRKH